MRQVRLYGELGKRFGRVHNLDVKTPAEAIRALSVLCDGFEKFLIDATKKNLAFQVFNSTDECEIDTLKIESKGSIKIIPKVIGANAESKMLAGVALVAIGFALSLTPATAAASPYFYQAGAAMILGGAIEMLAGRPVVPEPNEQADSRPSYLFNGAVNTQAQGQPVPIGYGRHIVGSAVISAAISNEILLGGS